MVTTNEDGDIALRFLKIGIPLVLVFVLLIGSFYTIQAGHRGVILTFGKPSEVSMGEGFHTKIPLVQRVVKMNVQTQRYDVTQASAASSDLQEVTTDVTVNYFISPESVPEIYRTIGINYQEKIITPAVQEVLKAATAEYTAEELVTKRPLVKEEIDIKLTERVRQYNIIVQSISITDFQFSEIFNNAIENKVTAQQNALAAKNKLEQVEYEKQQRIAQAQGEAEAIAIQAKAITTQGGKDYVALQAINKWDGSVPLYVSGDGNIIPFLDISRLTSTTPTA